MAHHPHSPSGASPGPAGLASPSPSRPEEPNGRHLGRPLAGDRLARALGWASLGLGVPGVARPGAVAKAVGVDDAPAQRAVATVVGVRELAAAAGLLQRTSPAWLWARVGGDAMDLALLGRALKNHDRRSLRRTAVVTASVVGITAVDLYAAVTRSGRTTVMELTATTTVHRPPQEVYAYWRDLEHLPLFMAHLEEVRVTGERTSHWRASGPLGKDVEWDAEITEDVPGERIAWRWAESADVPHQGAVRFVPAPGGRGTEVHVMLKASMPGGKLGLAVTRFFGAEPHQQLDDNLRRFKQVMETGEVVRSDGAPWGKRARREFPQRPARPLSKDELGEEARA
jgi:uncharacterized membrane protein